MNFVSPVLEAADPPAPAAPANPEPFTLVPAEPPFATAVVVAKVESLPGFEEEPAAPPAPTTTVYPVPGVTEKVFNTYAPPPPPPAPERFGEPPPLIEAPPEPPPPQHSIWTEVTPAGHVQVVVPAVEKVSTVAQLVPPDQASATMPTSSVCAVLKRVIMRSGLGVAVSVGFVFMAAGGLGFFGFFFSFCFVKFWASAVSPTGGSNNLPGNNFWA